MDIIEQVNYVNKKLQEGFSTAKVEKELKIGKDTLRQRLNKQGYKYNRKLNQYILESQQDFPVTNKSKQIYDINETKRKSIISDTEINKQKSINLFTEQEIKLLRELITKQNNIKTNNIGLKKLMSEDYKSTTLQIEKNLYKQLEEYCFEHKLTKKTVINQALISFLK